MKSYAKEQQVGVRLDSIGGTTVGWDVSDDSICGSARSWFIAVDSICRG